jgi:hypothetical protein
MKGPTMAARGSALQIKQSNDSPRKPRLARRMACLRTGVTRQRENRVWNNWLTEENYL